MKPQQREYFQTAIDILTTDQNWKGICVAIAKKYPRILCEAANIPSVRSEVKKVVVASGKVPAIKKYRELTGGGLIEAKEYVESNFQYELMEFKRA